MIDDAIKLIKLDYELDRYGNQIETVTEERTVFCKVRSGTRNEFYGAGTEQLRPDFVFILSDYREYEGETYCKYVDFSGAEKVYKIIRSYISGQELELTARERIQNNELG